MFCRDVVRVAATLVVAAFLTATSAATQETESSAAPSQKRFYAVLFAAGPGFVAETDGHGQPGMEQHVKFIMGMHADGVVPLGGALFDDDEREQVSGILYFVKAGSVQEARDIALREPLLKTQVVEIVSVREFITGVGVGRLD